MRHITDLKDGENIVEHYLCKKRQTGKTRSGKNYLSLTLADKTGVVEAKVWDLNNQIQSFEENDFIKIDGEVQIFNNELQIKVNRIRKSTEGEYDKMDYIPSSDKDINAIYAQLEDYIKSIENTYLKQLLESILIKNKTINSALKIHSAAKNMHHSYMGGLAEHTLSVVQICDFLGERYKKVNRDILLTSALLHDIGKIYELSPFPENDYTDEGQLIGHIIIMNDIITEEASKIPGFPDKLKNLVKHCILSHHGEFEFGSPKKPQIIEAFILHCADNTDAKIKMLEDFIDNDTSSGPWVGYNKIFGQYIRKSDF